jgi:hypothetical protein
LTGRAELIDRERRWALPVALLTILATLALIASIIVLGTTFSADGEADQLREVDSNSGSYLMAGILRGLGTLLLAAPLLYLFRAAEGRNDGVRGQLVGVVFVAPLFMAVGAVLNAQASINAAADFLAQGITGSGEGADERATDFLEEESLRSLATGLSLAGALGLAVIMVYTCLQAMRVGLLSRFWGSLGMALGAVSFIIPGFQPFLTIWFIYLGLLIAGWVPGGRPPAWAAAEAIPWPTPGEQAAERLQSEDGPNDEPEAGSQPSSNPPRERGERRKRKRRS